ncbi:hypothetical protein GH714_008525 [Hevea brasiliensis]|uniref:Exocyst subunit Exo70 family protein n=1 Tax=Hevea brasiliensis TaxID=3981 RepID=A0A6A6LQT4_HEVBR|nr:hypothetical protein GH714_008525 [Hevea brasiliensis]
MYKKQSNWVMPEIDLREKTCQLIVQAVLPVYRSYMQNYGPLVEQDGISSKYAKYSVQALEQMLGSLFQPRPGRYGSFKGRPPSEKFNNGLQIFVVQHLQLCDSPAVIRGLELFYGIFLLGEEQSLP